ncbi:MAG: cryptochrome/photolyase family protein [Steroidobacteraceae bacterium]
MRNLVVVLGDQLDLSSRAFDGFDPAVDAVWLAEVAAESTHVRSHKARIALFLAAMRHFRDALRERGWPVLYRDLDSHAHASLGAALAAELAGQRPQRVVMVQPGEHRVLAQLQATVAAHGAQWELRPDAHFYCTPEDFARWAGTRRGLRLEYVYRWLRQRERLLMYGDEPCGGRWNFDAENRGSFGAGGPGFVPPPLAFAPDAITREVFALVERRFAEHPGSLARFDWPVTRADAVAALEDFIAHRLRDFGRWQDAMWTGEPWLYHARIAAALNLKLLDPREVCAAAERAFRSGDADLAAVEGFVRQVAGWREYVRGIYWREMPGYLERNALDAHHALPAFYWNGDTDMACARECVRQTLDLGYAHHIQRLMVTGLFALLWGAEPREVHEWYLAVYVDAVEWVELPNTLGMSQYADGGLLGSKPYVATGKYVDRMSNYCAQCRYAPERASGADACPFTALYWDFLARHRDRFAAHPRMALQVKNLQRLAPAQLAAIAERVAELRAQARF